MKITIKLDGAQVYFTVNGVEYRTDTHGDGLWKYSKTTTYDLHDDCYICDWRQIEGTSQFDLHQQTRSGMRRAIERYFADEEE